ncbi:Helix-turn-helix domain protein [Roseovarius litorisediminis]|uniref:Helix-turn-helix domain protein n=1 Tax=Roseovarius litorisediminis TaxID=1312363 RepID=A0A1Y5S0V6_9RHOB|nr:helix-turn-helix transcriptional regulator [Roseovarius litorisediminis]SLN29792.1 Helix-turn-helix domain protein [Roseovarius litorisediminis]
MTQDFSKNLRSICADTGSIAKVCREIGINRQQFNRYLNGSGMPSAHNLRRIARHFDLSEADLFADHTDFTQRHILQHKHNVGDTVDLMTGAFRDQARSLRRYLGFYHAHFQTPTWDGMILRSLVWLREKDGFVMCRSLERVRSKDGSINQKSRYEGMATQRGNRIYVVEHEMVRDGSIVETILTPSYRQEVKFLRGVTMGVAWRPNVNPYASRSIWKRVDERISAREALKACGAFSTDSRHIDPTVRDYLTAQTDQTQAGNTANILV